MQFVYDDGGREKAGYKGKTGDCVTRSIAIVSSKPYQEVYSAINLLAQDERTKGKQSNARLGVYKRTYREYILSLGFEWTPTMQIGSGCKVHLKAGELPPGKLIVKVSRHLVAVIDGIIHDTSDPSRNGTRCVYGYYRQKSKIV